MNFSEESPDPDMENFKIAMRNFDYQDLIVFYLEPLQLELNILNERENILTCPDLSQRYHFYDLEETLKKKDIINRKITLVGIELNTIVEEYKRSQLYDI